MQAKAHLRYARISPRKVQIVCDLIRGKSVAQATAILMGTPKAASAWVAAPGTNTPKATKPQARSTAKWAKDRLASRAFTAGRPAGRCR